MSGDLGFLEMHNAAQGYAMRGWRVVPILPGQKRPHIDAWPEHATTNPAIITQWFTQWPDDGVGIACGESSGIFVIDVDVADGKVGARTLTDLEATHGELPETYSVRTPTGGWHYYYRFDPDRPIRNGKLGTDVDIRGEGGQVLAPPTIHPTVGTAYQLHLDIEVADAPEWVYSILLGTDSPEPAYDPDKAPRSPDDGQLRPGDDYNARATWQEILPADKWTFHHVDRKYPNVGHWTRPGKDKKQGSSASTNFDGKDMIRIFSGKVDGFDPDTSYQKFTYYTIMHHAGDASAAASALRKLGYGSPEIDHSWADRKPTNSSDVAHVAHPEQEVRADLGEVLDNIDKLLSRWVAFPTSEDRWAVAAWIVHAWCIDAFESSPRLALLSAERGSGKTRVLEVIELLAPNPMHTVNISPAALFRQIADASPTLLLDEADTYLGLKTSKDHEDLRGLVNAGHRRGAEVYRCVIDKGVKVEKYNAFCPVALAGIGDLPDTIVDRSVVVKMKRRAPGEVVGSFRNRKARAACDPVKASMKASTEHWVEMMADVEPEMPEGIEDRPADVWEALIIIGDTAGGVWEERLRQAAVSIVKASQERDPSLGVQLLADCRTIFDDKGVDRLTTETLLEALNGMVESPWGDLRGMPLEARGLASRLRKYGPRPGDHRFTDATRKGYLRADFHDAWIRYLPPVEDGQQGQQGQQVAETPEPAADEVPDIELDLGSPDCTYCGLPPDADDRGDYDWCPACCPGAAW